MKTLIVSTLCLTLSGSALAQTLTIQTEPTGLEVWRDGEQLGVSPVTIEGPFDDPVEITVKSPKGDHVSYVKVPPDEENHIVFISIEKDTVVKKPSILTPILGIIGGAALITALFFIWAFAHG